ncbi:hypothetical protein FO519_005922 [Halicephalobus sp. NKZ332]|nr:hypothetical protein FO519_005922 [Halicephalobus sp. NKZ332]
MLSWTNIDNRNAALASVVPIGLGLIQYNSLRPGQAGYTMFKTSAKPNWMNVSPSVFGFADLLALSPLGYASYLVYKYGGGFEYHDTSVALALYGTSIVFSGYCPPLHEHREYRWLLINKTIGFLTGLGFTYAFYKIDERAGLLSVPYALLSAFCMYNYYKLFQMNDNKKEKL